MMPQTITESTLTIDSFTAENHILSNFWERSPFVAPYIWWPDRGEFEWATTEHFYQAHKAITIVEAESVREMNTPGGSKRRGRKVRLQDGWNTNKDLIVMRIALRHKFGPCTEAGKFLMGTGEAYLIEGNKRGDTYWGTVDGQGRNYLGRLLMVRRLELNLGL